MHSSAGHAWRWVLGLLLCALEASLRPGSCQLYHSMSQLVLLAPDTPTCAVQPTASLCLLRAALLMPDFVVCVLQPPAGHDVFEWSIIQAFGIFAVSVSGHSSLPVLRNSMAKPQVGAST